MIASVALCTCGGEWGGEGSGVERGVGWRGEWGGEESEVERGVREGMHKASAMPRPRCNLVHYYI